MATEPAPAPAASSHVAEANIAELRQLLGEPAGATLDGRLHEALDRYCAIGRERGVFLERLVNGLRQASAGADRAQVSDAERETRFSAALVRLLACFFEEADR